MYRFSCQEQILVLSQIYSIFFSNSYVKSYLDFILKNPYKIYSEELYIHLRFLLTYALDAVFEIDVKYGFISLSEGNRSRFYDESSHMTSFSKIWEIINESPDTKETYEIGMKAIHEVMKNMDFEYSFKLKDKIKMKGIYIEFPQMYIEALKTLTYSEAFLACFMDNCTNSSIWGTYGDNHTGVCLKYKIKDEKNPKLNLKTTVGFSSSGNSYNYVEFPLKKMIYSREFDELDFFRNIGRLSIPQLTEQWYTNENGDYSTCGKHLFSGVEEWRSKHWDNFEAAYLKKHPDWSHEKEYRITLSSGLNSFNDPSDRLLEYKFEDLESIVFGIKTSAEDRYKIIELIKEKCKKEGRKHFDFYEMAYLRSKQAMYPRKIYSIKLDAKYIEKEKIKEK